MSRIGELYYLESSLPVTLCKMMVAFRSRYVHLESDLIGSCFSCLRVTRRLQACFVLGYKKEKLKIGCCTQILFDRGSTFWAPGLLTVCGTRDPDFIARWPQIQQDVQRYVASASESARLCSCFVCLQCVVLTKSISHHLRNHGKPLIVGIYREIIIPGLLRWCRISAIKSMMLVSFVHFGKRLYVFLFFQVCNMVLVDVAFHSADQHGTPSTHSWEVSK